MFIQNFKLWDMIPGAPTTTGATSAFNFHIFPDSIANLGTYLSFLVFLRWYSGLLVCQCQWLSSLLLFFFYVYITRLYMFNNLISLDSKTSQGFSSFILSLSDLKTFFHFVPLFPFLFSFFYYVKLCGTFCIVGTEFSLLLYQIFFGIGSLPD